MRICRVTGTYVPRICGWSHHVRALSVRQAAFGHEIVLLHAQPSAEAAVECGGKLAALPVDLGLLRRFWGRWWGRLYFALLAARRIRRLHAESPFDLIHAHGDIFEIWALARLARSLGVPLVVTVHSGLSRRRHYELLARRAWRSVDGVIAVSEDIARRLEGFGVPRSDIAVISSGVALPDFAPLPPERKLLLRRELGLPPDAFIVAGVGRLVSPKGFRYLIEAARLLQKNRPPLFLIVGDGPLRTELQGLARGLPNVRFLGERAHAGVPRCLQAADAFALASVDEVGHREGTPTAVLEAMAAGLPVITTDSGGACEVVETVPGTTVVPQRDPAALAEAISRLRDDAMVRELIGAANLRRARSRDWEAVARKVSSFLERAARGAR